MERRDILKASAMFLGYGLAGGASIAVLNGCKADTSPDWTPKFFSQEQINLLAEVAERIIPKTDTPGAKDALVHRYIDDAVRWNYSEEDKMKMKEGLGGFDKIANVDFGKRFVDLSTEDMDKVIQKTADMAKKAKKEGDDSPQLFPTIKGLVASGYFTSEVGATQALIYDPIPGPYQGCIPFDEVGGTYASL